MPRALLRMLLAPPCTDGVHVWGLLSLEQEPQPTGWPGRSGLDAGTYQGKLASPNGEGFASRADAFDHERRSDAISIASTRTADGVERDMQVRASKPLMQPDPCIERHHELVLDSHHDQFTQHSHAQAQTSRLTFIL
jgi:hypothetical protein